LQALDSEVGAFRGGLLRQRAPCSVSPFSQSLSEVCLREILHPRLQFARVAEIVRIEGVDEGLTHDRFFFLKRRAHVSEPCFVVRIRRVEVVVFQESGEELLKASQKFRLLSFRELLIETTGAQELFEGFSGVVAEADFIVVRLVVRVVEIAQVLLDQQRLPLLRATCALLLLVLTFLSCGLTLTDRPAPRARPELHEVHRVWHRSPSCAFILCVFLLCRCLLRINLQDLLALKKVEVLCRAPALC